MVLYLKTKRKITKGHRCPSVKNETMKTKIKQWILTNWTIIALVIVILLYSKSCQGSKDLEHANTSLKKDVEWSENKVTQLLKENKIYSKKVDSLEKVKQKAIVQVQEVEKKTKSEIKKVPNLTKKGIANYYQGRYKLPVTIKQYGVSVSDTIGKLNITELIQKDGCFAERNFLKQQITIEEQKGVLKDSMNDNLINANAELSRAIYTQKKVILNTENIVKKEKTKKTFWQVTTGAAAVVIGVLVLR